ncbi:retrovirus-related pol polyprotein from transposon TNT 1-94 [Tanacetum coccineum]
MIIKKDSKIVKEKVERKSLALKAKKESSDEECLTSESEDEEITMAGGQDFKKFFKRRGRFVRQPRNDKKNSKEVMMTRTIKVIENALDAATHGEEDDEKVNNETCLVAQASSEICLGVDLEPDEWIKDSGCSKHMTVNRKLFSTYKAYNGGNVIFGSNLHGNIIGKGTISNDFLKIDNVEHVDNLGFNLLSIEKYVIIKRLRSRKYAYLQSLASKELVRKPTLKLSFDHNIFVMLAKLETSSVSHKANIRLMTTCFDLIHMDLFGPSAVRIYGGNRYTLVIVDDYSRYTWTRFLKNKTEASDQFKIFSKKIQNQLGCTIVSIRTDHGREFDNEVQFGEFCNANGNFSQLLALFFSTLLNQMAVEEILDTSRNEYNNVIRAIVTTNVLDVRRRYFNIYSQQYLIKNTSLGKTPYEILRGWKTSIDYFRVFLEAVLHLNTKGIPYQTSPLVDDDLDEEEAIREIKKKNLENVAYWDETLEIDEIGKMFVEFVIQNQYFSLCIEDFAQILRIPCEGACIFSDRWSLDELVYGAPLEGPYQTNRPSPDDIILYVLEDREGQVTRIRIKKKLSEYPELKNESYVLYDHVMTPLAAQLERKPRRDRGTRRGRQSTFSSSAFDQPSSSYLNDDDDDGNDEGTSRASTPSPIRYVNSLTNQVPQVFQNPPNIDPHLEPFYTHQTEIVNRQVQLRDEHRGRVRSIGKSLRKLWRKIRK